MNYQINNFNFQPLNSGQFYQFMNLAYNALQNADPTDKEIKDEKLTFKQMVDMLLLKYDEEKAHEETKLIEDLDIKRDTLFNALYSWAKGLAILADDKDNPSAVVVLNYLNTLPKGIAQLPFQNESTELTRLTEDFKNITALKDAATNCAVIKNFVGKIETTNKEFIITYGKRSEKIGKEKEDKVTFGGLRPNAKKVFIDTMQVIESLCTTALRAKKDATIWITCINEINGNIDRYKQLIKQAKTTSVSVEQKAEESK